MVGHLGEQRTTMGLHPTYTMVGSHVEHGKEGETVEGGQHSTMMGQCIKIGRMHDEKEEKMIAGVEKDAEAAEVTVNSEVGDSEVEERGNQGRNAT